MRYNKEMKQKIETLLSDLKTNPEHKIPFFNLRTVASCSAIKMHNAWREIYIATKGNVPRIKTKADGTEVNINVPGEFLDPEFLAANVEMSFFVLGLIELYSKLDIEACSDIIHDKWLEMNAWAKGGPLDVPYESLPETEKEKDRDVYRTVMETFIQYNK
jgi:hypothetical protein